MQRRPHQFFMKCTSLKAPRNQLFVRMSTEFKSRLLLPLLLLCWRETSGLDVRITSHSIVAAVISILQIKKSSLSRIIVLSVWCPRIASLRIQFRERTMYEPATIWWKPGHEEGQNSCTSKTSVILLEETVSRVWTTKLIIYTGCAKAGTGTSALYLQSRSVLFLVHLY